METELKVIAERIPWAPIVLLTIIFGFFGPVYLSIMPNPSWYTLGNIGCSLMLSVTPLLFIMGIAIVGRLAGKPISAANYTFLYATGIGLIAGASVYGFPIGEPFLQILYDKISVAQDINPWPSFMAPSADAIRQMLTGGTGVPWGAWVPTITWWWLLAAALATFSLGWGVVWRRRWIDIEKVPFPQTQVSIELVERITSTEKSVRARAGMPFLIGSILGIAFQLPLLLAYMYLWFPDIYGWRTNTCKMGTTYITPDSPLAGIVGFAQFNKNPAFGAIFYMAPLNVLFGVWFWYLVFIILMQIAYTAGYYTGITGYSGCGRVWCGVTGYRVGDPFKWDVFSSAGVTTGIFISYIALNWKYLSGTFSVAIGRLSNYKSSEFETGEPTSYKNAYLMIFGSAILIIALFMISDVSFPVALLLVITHMIVGFVTTRGYSLVGYAVPAGTHFYDGPMKTLLGGGVGGANREWFVAMGFTQGLVNEAVENAGYGFPLISSLSSYQMASVNKVSTKSVFRVLLFVCVSGPLLSVIGAVWGFYAFGVTKMPTSSSLWCSCFEGRTPSAEANRPAYEPWLQNMLAGMIFAGLLSVLHARFTWFPLEPFGFLLATDGHALVEGIWTMCLAAWILKTITFRIGGSKLYERRGIPTAIGFIIGVVVVSIIGGILLAIRFFYPF